MRESPDQVRQIRDLERDLPSLVLRGAKNQPRFDAEARDLRARFVPTVNGGNIGSTWRQSTDPCALLGCAARPAEPFSSAPFAVDVVPYATERDWMQQRLEAFLASQQERGSYLSHQRRFLDEVLKPG